MLRPALFFILFMMLMVAGCKSQDEVASGSDATAAAPEDSVTSMEGAGAELPPLPPEDAEVPPMPGDFRLRLERTACYGSCPIFEAKLNIDGSLQMHSKRFVEGLANDTTYEKQVDEAARRAAWALLFRHTFWDLAERYDEDVSDMPSVIIEARGGGRIHKVVGRANTPERFDALVRKLEALLKPREGYGPGDR
jgi:hypothetical protein